MLRLLVVAVLCVLGVSFINGQEPSNFGSEIEIITVQNLTEYVRNHPKMKFQPMQKEFLARAQIRYTIGRRVNGDRLVAVNSQSQQWPTAQDVTLTLTYPGNGTGAIVSYVEVLVEQSSNVGQGYVASGGIGQRRIVVVIEAIRTTYFRHASQIFGN